MSSAGPVGVFDSGVGGLSVLRALRDELPHEQLVYVADSGHAPYGDRSPDFIEGRATALTAFLLSEGAKAVVVACNTVTGAAIDALRTRFSVPIIAIEPAVKPAAATTRSGVVGVMATSVTLGSPNFARLVERFSGAATVLTQPCPGLVEHVERGILNGPETRALVERFLRPLLDRGADTIVLGCTHYAFLEPVIRELAGPNVTIIDPAAAVARETRRRLADAALLRPTTVEGGATLWTSGSLDAARSVFRVLWQGGPDVRPLPASDAEARV